MDKPSIMERAKAGDVKLEPMRKVLCSCQKLDPRTGKAKESCVCKRAQAGRLK